MAEKVGAAEGGAAAGAAAADGGAAIAGAEGCGNRWTPSAAANGESLNSANKRSDCRMHTHTRSVRHTHASHNTPCAAPDIPCKSCGTDDSALEAGAGVKAALRSAAVTGCSSNSIRPGSAPITSER